MYTMPEKGYKMQTLDCLEFALILGQCFGLLPFEIIKRKQSVGVYFRWMSLKTIYAILCLIVLILNAAIYLYNSFKAGISFGNIGRYVLTH